MAITKKPSCPKDHILRESYKVQSGKRVSARCIRKPGLIHGKSTDKTVSLLKKASQRASHAMKLVKKLGLPIKYHCPKGTTLRKGYTRRSYNRKTGTHVKHGLVYPGCIKTRGKLGSKEKVIVLDPDDHYLSKFGYYNVEDKTTEQRHSSLHKLIKHFIPIKGEMASYNYVIRALNARYILNRNTNRKIAKIFKADQRAFSKEYDQLKLKSKKAM